ncbi:MAG: hypothetical protein DME18_02275 [Verrucomicrobia bacterium]|nr:MAG: hypothetical protein DME18_02275 [Verrucomicrobiota bacterium]
MRSSSGRRDPVESWISKGHKSGLDGVSPHLKNKGEFAFPSRKHKTSRLFAGWFCILIGAWRM